MSEITTSGIEQSDGESVVAVVWPLVYREDQASLHRLNRLGLDVFLPAARAMLMERISDGEKDLARLRDALARVEREAEKLTRREAGA